MSAKFIILFALLFSSSTVASAAQMSKASAEACARAQLILTNSGVTEPEFISQAKDQNELEMKLKSLGWVVQKDPFSKTTTFTNRSGVTKIARRATNSPV